MEPGDRQRVATGSTFVAWVSWNIDDGYVLSMGCSNVDCWVLL